MATKDVKLVISARNEASKTLDSVASSLKKVNDAQANAAKSAKGVDGSFESLGAEVARLTAKVDGLKSLGTVATELNKVRTSITSMEASLRNTTTDFGKFAIEAAQAAKAVVGLVAQSEALTATFARQKAETDAAKKETLKGSEAVKEMTKAKRELDALTKKGTDTAAIAAATAAYERASLAVERNKAAHAQLQTELADTKNKLGDVNAQLGVSRREYNSLIGTAENLADSSKVMSTTIEGSKAALADLDGQALATARALGAVTLEQADVEKVTRNTTEALKANSTALAAMARYSTGTAGGFTDPKTAATLRDQRAALDAAKAGWDALEAEVRQQAIAMRALDAPTAEQVAALKALIAATAEAKAETIRLQQAMLARNSGASSSFLEFTKGANTLRSFSEEAKKIPAAPSITPWRAFFNSVYGDSRKAMSIMQRLRGEVLALATAYVGLYGTINAIGGVISSYQKLEAAQNRLGVVFGQDAAATRKELEWLERQSNRLGVEFGTLADQYSKFAIAAKSGNFTAQGTRDIFVSVAEAGRVAKLSLEQMGGVFTALEQIISKGKIQSEELRHQLGDRLPGAFSIMAKALGKTTAELDKAMKNGEVLANESNLTKFANELTRQFGSQLPAALQTTTTLLGKFSNDIFQAQLQVGKGGFIKALDDGLRNLDEWFQSREGRDFFLSLGAALGKFVAVIAEVPKYFGLIQQAIQALVAFKVAQFFVAIAASARAAGVAAAQAGVQTNGFKAAAVGLAATMTAARSSIIAAAVGVTNFTRNISLARVGMVASAGSAGIMRGALISLNAAAVGATNVFRLLWAAVGGFPGLIITAITFLTSTLIGNWLGGVDDVTAAMDEHQRITQEVLTAYESLADKTDKWADSIKNVTREQAESNYIKQLELQKKALDDLNQARRRADVAADLKSLIPGGATAELQKYRDLVVKGFDNSSVEEYIDSLVKLNSTVQDLDLKKQIIDQIAFAQAYKDSGDAVNLAAAYAKTMNSTYEGLNMTVEQAAVIIGDSASAADDAAGAMDDAASSADDFKAALDDLKGFIPEVAAEMKKLKDLSELDTSWADILKYGPPTRENFDLYNQARESIQSKDAVAALRDATGVADKSAALLRGFEGFIEVAKNDPRTDRNGNQVGADIYRAGYGSDTIRLADDTVVKITEGMRVSVEDANRDLAHRIGEFQAGVIRDVGPENFKKYTADQQAVLNSLAYNYGSLPKDIAAAIKANASDSQIASLIRGHGGDNGGVNGPKGNNRRGIEANIFGGGARDLAAEEKAAQAVAEAERKGAESSAQSVADAKESVRQAELQTQGKERQLAIGQAITAAEKANGEAVKLTKDQITEIAQAAGKAWDEENVNRVRIAEEAATKQRLADMGLENSQQELINAGKEREVAIEQAVAAAMKENSHLTGAQLEEVKRLAGEKYDLANKQKLADEAHKKAEEEVNRLLEYRQSLQQTMALQLAQGDAAGAANTKVELEGVNTQLQAAIENAIKMWQAIGGPEADVAIAKLRQTQLEIKGASTEMTLFGLNTSQWGNIAADFATGLTGVFDKFAQAIANGEDAIGALGEAFLQFAAEFLINIGKMIIQQAILNALQGFLGGFGITVPGASIPLGHTGGLVGSKTIGSGNGRRNLMANIPYFHDGGVVGLKPDETMAVLRQNEEVLTENDPRHIFNQGGGDSGGGSAAPNIKIVNAFDAGDVVSEGMNSAVGESTFINMVKKNASTISAILGK